MSDKPKMIFFNGPWDFLGTRSRLIQTHLMPFRRLLEQDFNVVSIEGDCDFAASVEAHKPDVVMFCPSFESPQEPIRKITNTDRYPEIPRLGYLWRDPFTPTRLRILTAFDEWGVEQIFAPFRKSEGSKVLGNLMYIPYWSDPWQFRDYGLEKEFPVFLFGAGWLGDDGLYPWRGKVGGSLMRHFPVVHAPSMGNNNFKERMVGKECARMLNRSHFSPACTTVSHLLTCKMIEIPASRCCLITEDIALSRALGFEDEVNCIFTKGDDVVEKVNRLLDEPEKLKAITDAGYQLVTEKHGAQNRRMIFEWYELWKERDENQRIVQTNPFKPLSLIAKDAPEPEDPYADSPFFEQLSAGYELLAMERVDEAFAKFTECQRQISYSSESILGLGICLMKLGNWKDAFNALYKNLHFSQVMHSPVYDPVSLAICAVAAFRVDRAGDAVKILQQQPQYVHPAMNAARAIAASLIPQLKEQSLFGQIPSGPEANIKTLHLLPDMSFREWVSYLTGLIQAQCSFGSAN